MNSATLTAPVRTIFREFPLALPEPMESQLARAGFAPWMLTPHWNEHRATCRKIGEVQAYAQIDGALRYLTIMRGIGLYLWQTKVQEQHIFADGTPWTEEKRLHDMLEQRRDFIAHKLARQLVEQRAERNARQASRRNLKRLAA